jgi:hypothetical protein
MSNSKAQFKATEKFDYEILFKDSPEYFVVQNAKMIPEGKLVRFICFDSALPTALLKEEVWYPINNIFRIKRYDRSYERLAAKTSSQE